MAISGSGGWVPAARVFIYRRQMYLAKPFHNVPKEVLWMPEQAAARFDDCPDDSIYVALAEEGGTLYLHDLLVEMGLIDDPHANEWRGG